MKIEEIEIGGTYYYNNRECYVIAREGDTDFFRVKIEIDVNTEIEGSNFCMQCNVGGDYKGSHTCDEAGEVIDAVIEDIHDSVIVCVPAQYLYKHPIEFKKNQELIDSIAKKEEELIKINEWIKVKENEKLGLSLSFKSNIEICESAIKNEEEKLNNAKIELENIQKEINENKLTLVNISKTGKTISADTLLGLIKDSLILNALESGGVDNWTWYGESMGDRDFDKEAWSKLLDL